MNPSTVVRPQPCSRFARVAGAFAMAIALNAAPVLAASPKSITHTIVMDVMTFSPASLAVNKGDKVVWINKDMFPHTATAKGAFDSGVLQPHAKWTYTANKRGEFAYVCTLHPTMKGALVVR
jgi:plastocyanin